MSCLIGCCRKSDTVAHEESNWKTNLTVVIAIAAIAFGIFLFLAARGTFPGLNVLSNDLFEWAGIATIAAGCIFLCCIGCNKMRLSDNSSSLSSGEAESEPPIQAYTIHKPSTRPNTFINPIFSPLQSTPTRIDLPSPLSPSALKEFDSKLEEYNEKLDTCDQKKLINNQVSVDLLLYALLSSLEIKFEYLKLLNITAEQMQNDIDNALEETRLDEIIKLMARCHPDADSPPKWLENIKGPLGIALKERWKPARATQPDSSPNAASSSLETFIMQQQSALEKIDSNSEEPSVKQSRKRRCGKLIFFKLKTMQNNECLSKTLCPNKPIKDELTPELHSKIVDLLVRCYPDPNSPPDEFKNSKQTLFKELETAWKEKLTTDVPDLQPISNTPSASSLVEKTAAVNQSGSTPQASSLEAFINEVEEELNKPQFDIDITSALLFLELVTINNNEELSKTLCPNEPHELTPELRSRIVDILVRCYPDPSSPPDDFKAPKAPFFQELEKAWREGLSKMPSRKEK